jgi:hypothetical protein
MWSSAVIPLPAPLGVHARGTYPDLLHRIAGDSAEKQDELLMELVAEVGPVKPDPKLWPVAKSRAG